MKQRKRRNPVALELLCSGKYKPRVVKNKKLYSRKDKHKKSLEKQIRGFFVFTVSFRDQLGAFGFDPVLQFRDKFARRHVFRHGGQKFDDDRSGIFHKRPLAPETAGV